MSATIVASVPGEDRFVRFLWISAVVHLVLVGVFIGVAKFPKSETDAEILSFELVGNPPRGPAGPPASPPPAPASEALPTPEAAAPVTPLPEPSIPVPTSKPADPKPAASKTPQAGVSPSSAKPLPAGPLAGSPTGDTLSVGGQGGPPTAMNLWLSRVKYLVERNWTAPQGLPGVAASPEVVFDVARDGRASRPKLRVKSGSPILDGLALRAISSVELFPPVPSSWKSDLVTVRYVLEYAH